MLECSIAKFTQLGSKHVTLDEIANALGISKKTIYTFFETKEALVTSSLERLLNTYKEDINRIISSNTNDPILCVVLIYKRGFTYLKYFTPSFLFDLQKYYPKAGKVFDDFTEEVSTILVFNLLQKAQRAGAIKQEVNLELMIKAYFFRLDTLLFKNNNLFELYTKEALFKHLVIYNLKGIITSTYSNSYLV
ncbi:TetR/AcrR family transcriptional regulator [Oceanihabitans sp. 2_MG-2023]|uniref:TetR/AcrR family transcriptional regulator n=1 Tax=Oceanihabitans sp. 2_MG-2023 TaxID=3062661 RepID=UPI0026E199C9|nr:TetR/AcrR family transcriptional regulator [Oceanihabitans sp. 2_MG-2023]MDO6595704.1 TetR/AcrR family transcriptional regulator [Oceanihabitans sp. 2_MG-2023]